jgi:ATP-dependent 26S proteasome regulatory subunit
MATIETAGQRMASEVGALLKARNALLWVVTPEEGRVERALIGAASAKGVDYPVRMWDCVAGVTNAVGEEAAPGRACQDPAVVLNYIRDLRERSVWILRDLHKWMDPTILRSLRNLAKSLPKFVRSEARAVVILSPSTDVPPELQDHAVVVKWELPDRAEIGSIYDGVLSGLKPEDASAINSDVREQAVEAAVGLSAEAAASCFSKSLVTQGKRIVPAVIAAEKKRVVKGKGLEWFDADSRGLDAVGGLEPLKEWLTRRRAAFSQRARDYGLPLPKGLLLVGVPGCGKSLSCKAVAAAWGVPLLRADFGGAKSKWVGESEDNIRKVFAVAEAVGNCVLWIDEIEKALGGATQGAADGGVSSDALGTFLSWMQERKGSVFVIATANDVRALPPELLRKGRFDELFFVDLPTQREREEILRVSLKKFGRTVGDADCSIVARKCEGFTGAEVAEIVPDALFAAFADGERALSVADLVASAASVAPLSKTAKEKIDGLREWARGRARPASLPEVQSTGGSERALDL